MPFLMIGYHPTRGYKLFDPKTGKAIVRRDVVMDETSVLDKNENQHEESRIVAKEANIEVKCDSEESDTGMRNNVSVRRSSRS